MNITRTNLHSYAQLLFVWNLPAMNRFKAQFIEDARYSEGNGAIQQT